MKTKLLLTALVTTAVLSANALDYNYTALRCTGDAVYLTSGKYVEQYISRNDVTLAKAASICALDADISSYASHDGTTMFTYADSGQPGAIYATDGAGNIKSFIPDILQDLVGEGFAHPTIKLYQDRMMPERLFANFINTNGECFNIISYDFGDSWQMTELSDPVICLTMKVNVLYAAIAEDDERLSILRSSDSGTTWSTVTTIDKPHNSTLDIDISDTDDGLIVVTCDTPFVYDCNAGVTSLINENVEEDFMPIRRYGFLHDSDNLMTFNSTDRTLDVSSDYFTTRTSYEYPGATGIAERIDGWARSGNRIYAHCAQTRTILDLDFDAIVASCRPAIADSTAEAGITVRDLSGRIVLQRDDSNTDTLPLSSGLYIITTGDTSSKVAIR